MRYTGPAIALHWLMVPLILAALAMGAYMVGLHISPQKLRLYSWHKWIGVSVFALAVIRIGWRLRHRPPPAPPLPPWQLGLARTTHALMYLSFLVIPLSGWIFSSAKGIPTVYLGWLTLPDLVGKDDLLAAVAKRIHLLTAYGLGALAVLHVAAALKHQFIDRDGLLRRMLPVGPTAGE